LADFSKEKTSFILQIIMREVSMWGFEKPCFGEALGTALSFQVSSQDVDYEKGTIFLQKVGLLVPE
jgi:hypothetical protein